VVKYGHPIFLIPSDWPKLSRLIAFAIGAATTLAFAPFGLSLLAPLLLLPFLYICLTVAPRDAAGHAFWYGFGLFLTGTYWIYISVHVFGNAALWIAILLMLGLALLMACVVSLAGWLTSRLSQGEPWLLLLVAPAAWVIAEWVRGWILTGFPWMALGYGQIDSVIAGWAPVVGVYGVSFMLVLSAAAVIVAHNHPSGVSEPSQADERITRRLKSALELVDIRLLDHLIIGDAGATSLASRGLL